MKISLANFRCHENREFEIPSEGLVALSGKTGAGKSTILSAISYAFYGKIPGKIKKPYSHGKKTCRVEITLPLDEHSRQLYISRTSKPNSVCAVIDDVQYEDDAAESIIQTALSMNYEEFIAGAYIVQRSNASVLSMTPGEQIKFVEILAAHGDTVENFKTMLKEKIKKCKSKKLKKEGELEGLETQLEEKRENAPETEPDVPEEIQNGLDPNAIREKLKKHETSLIKINGDIQTVRLALDKQRSLDKGFSEQRRKIQKLKAEIEVFKSTLKEQTSAITEKQALSELENAQKELEIYETKENIYQDSKRLEEAIKAHYDSVDERIKILTNDDAFLEDQFILDLENRCQMLEEEVQEYDVKLAIFQQAVQKKEEARKKLGTIFKQIKTELCAGDNDLAEIKTPNKMIAFLRSVAAIGVKCPECEMDFHCDYNGNVLSSKNTQSMEIDTEGRHRALEFIKMIEDNGKNLDVSLTDPGNNRPDVSGPNKLLHKAKRIREELATLEKRELSATLLKMQQRIFSSAEKHNVDLNTFVLENKGEIHKNLDNAKKTLDDARRVEEQRLNIKANIEKREKQISGINKDIPETVEGGDVDSKSESQKLEKKLSALTQRSADANLHITNARDILDSFAEYENYQLYYKECESLQTKINAVLEEIAAIDTALEGLYGLEETGREAEILSLEETVRSINEHARVYLDQMFEDPIVVELSCMKEVKTKKTTKLQLNTSIIYQGDTYEHIEELSGGERQRCDMAFLLAINDMVGSKMILLDECLNNLDASINTEVLSMIRDLSGGHKLILVVSHEAVRGVFDSEVFV